MKELAQTIYVLMIIADTILLLSWLAYFVTMAICKAINNHLRLTINKNTTITETIIEED